MHFYAGIYARLSVEGTERKNESIDTQIAIAKQYIEGHPEMELYGCYTDSGRSGMDFKREGFGRMMQDMRKKRINCIVVKDLSRFGRNYIETGNYIQKIFPFMGVRFIAITDRIDTFEENTGTSEMQVNLTNLVNEMYARDIAVKTRSSKRSSKEQGSYTGGIAPYGYNTCQADGKRSLLICPETSGIVKDIYGMFLSGKNMQQIARVLYGRGIHRPGIYRKTGHVYCQEGEELEQWGSKTVKFILTNPVYMGGMVQGTARNHKPVISEDMFSQVAAMFGKSAAKYCNKNSLSQKVPLEEDIYAGILFCGNCGKRMARVANKKRAGSGNIARHYGYYCKASRRLDALQCQTERISKDILDGLVKTALYHESVLSGLCPGRLLKEYEKQAGKKKQQACYWAAQCEKQQESIKRKGSELYLKYHSGSLSLERFQQLKKENEKHLHEISVQKEELKNSLDGIGQKIKERGKFLCNLMEFNEKTKLTKDVVHTLVSRIDVYAGRRARITFTFCINNALITEGGRKEWKG